MLLRQSPLTRSKTEFELVGRGVLWEQGRTEMSCRSRGMPSFTTSVGNQEFNSPETEKPICDFARDEVCLEAGDRGDG